MQKRHQDRQCYFNELANTSRNFYIDYVKQFISLSSSTHILEIGCGEGGSRTYAFKKYHKIANH